MPEQPPQPQTPPPPARPSPTKPAIRGHNSSGRRWVEINEQRNLAIIVVGGFFFGAIALTRLVGVVEAGSLTLATLASLVLLALTFIMLLMWGWATRKELGMLEEVGGRHIPPLPGNSFPIVVAAAVLLGALGVATAWPLVFALVYLGLRAVEALGFGVLKQTVRDGIEAARVEPSDSEQSAALDALEHYYVQRPWPRLHVGQLVLAAGAAVLAAMAFLMTDASLKEALIGGAYAVLIVAILVNESIVHVWRRARGRDLPAVYR